MVHSLRAAPHDFSQLATSFFACPRLGILRAPLLRLTRVHYFRVPYLFRDAHSIDLIHLYESIYLIALADLFFTDCIRMQSAQLSHYPNFQKTGEPRRLFLLHRYFRSEPIKLEDPLSTVNLLS
jgi:hypothetical protein